MPTETKVRPRKVVHRPVDLLTELLRRNVHTDTSVPLLKMGDVLRDKPALAPVH